MKGRVLLAGSLAEIKRAMESLGVWDSEQSRSTGLGGMILVERLQETMEEIRGREARAIGRAKRLRGRPLTNWLRYGPGSES